MLKLYNCGGDALKTDYPQAVITVKVTTMKPSLSVCSVSALLPSLLFFLSSLSVSPSSSFLLCLLQHFLMKTHSDIVLGLSFLSLHSLHLHSEPCQFYFLFNEDLRL